MNKSPSPSSIYVTRCAAKLRAKEAAQMVGVTERTWYRWEAGTRKMSSMAWELFHVKLKERNQGDIQ